jgi:hypothetical protein
MATLKTTLANYVNLDTNSVTGATYTLPSKSTYTLVLTFSDTTGKTITVTPDSVTSN